MPEVLSVNVGRPRAVGADGGLTGIDKRPTEGPVEVRAPVGKVSGLAGDAICDPHNHGGEHQAVYAYAREDLDTWERELGRDLPSGVFGENLTTRGLDLTGAHIGERWRIGDELVLQVTAPRIPCRTFAVWLDQQGWVRRFNAAVRPGAYFRVLRPGPVAAGAPVVVEHVPDNDVTIGLTFRALTSSPELLPGLLVSPDLTPEIEGRARRRLER